MRVLQDQTSDSLKVALKGLATRQRAVAGNLANVETPGYQPRQVVFEQQLKAALGRVRGKKIRPSVQAVRPEVVTDQSSLLRRDGSGVDIEQELVQLVESGVHYQAAVRLLSRKYALLRTAIREGDR